jgi:tetratricopeptide (TPR) repeat protein
VAALVFLLFARLLPGRWPAFFGAALFAVHPVGTEAVSNIIGRADQLVALAVVASLLFYIRSTETTGWRKAMWLAGMALVTGAGLLSKENAVAVIGVILLYDLSFRTARWREWWVPVAVLAPVYLGVWALRKWVAAGDIPPQFPFMDNPLVGAPFWQAKLTALKVIGKSLGLFVWPAGLSCDYSYNAIPLSTVRDVATIVSVTVLLVLAAMAVWAWRRNRTLFFLMGFGFVALLPTANLLFTTGNIMGERLLYVSLIGFAGCAVTAAQAIHARWWPVILTAAVVGLGIRTFVRNYDWADSYSIWSSAARVCPGSYKVHKAMANSIYECDPQRRQIDEAIAVAERGLAIVEQAPVPLTQKSGDVYATLGAFFVDKGEMMPATSVQRVESYRRAVELLEQAAAIENAVMAEMAQYSKKDVSGMGDYHVYGNLGLAYLRLGRLEESLKAYQRMHRLAPAESKGYLGVALVYSGLGRREEAIVSVLQALLLDSNNQFLWQAVFDAYRQAGLAGQALRMHNGRTQLDLTVPVVREHICAAYRGLVNNCKVGGAAKLAAELEATAGKEYGCQPSTVHD